MSKRFFRFSPSSKKDIVQNTSLSPETKISDNYVNRGDLIMAGNQFKISSYKSNASLGSMGKNKNSSIKKSKFSSFSKSLSPTPKKSYSSVSLSQKAMKIDHKFEKLILPSGRYKIQTNAEYNGQKQNRSENIGYRIYRKSRGNFNTNKHLSKVSVSSRRSLNKIKSKVSDSDEIIKKEIEDLNEMLKNLLGESHENIEPDIIKTKTEKIESNSEKSEASQKEDIPLPKDIEHNIYQPDNSHSKFILIRNK